MSTPAQRLAAALEKLNAGDVGADPQWADLEDLALAVALDVAVRIADSLERIAAALEKPR